MNFRTVLVDTNPKMVAAWSKVFGSNRNVTLVHGSLTAQRTRAWVSPTNAQGRMDGGVDAAVKTALGRAIQSRVQRAIAVQCGPMMPVGFATCVGTSRSMPDYLISTPTMMGSGEDLRETLNVALACAAAIQAVKSVNREQGNVIESIAMPGLGAGTGRLSVDVCADLMWSAFDLHAHNEFQDFTEMRLALEDVLGDLGPLKAPKGLIAHNETPYRSAGAYEIRNA